MTTPLRRRVAPAAFSLFLLASVPANATDTITGCDIGESGELSVVTLPLSGPHPMVPRTSVPPGPPLRPADMTWVNTTLASMTLDEKIGQMIMPSYSSSSANSNVTTYKVTGFVFLGNSNVASTLLNNTNSLQAITSVPLIFALDCEPGAGARTPDATRFPMNMALGATGNPDLARRQGGVTARECRSMGIQIGFGPCVDVNTEPINPIIGIRSYGDVPGLVADLARAHVEGANAEGLLCTFKHYPGHGGTTGDSHSSLPVVDLSLDQLQADHIAPYSTLLSSGLGQLVMTAHVWYTALDPGPTAWPATLSTNALTSILRTQLGYTGAVISDSFGMAGLLNAAPTYDAVRIGVLAGLDIILMPTSMTDATNGLRDAVNGGQIPMSRIDDAVRRVLIMKSRVGIPEQTTNPVSVMNATLQHPDNLAAAREVAHNCIASSRVQPGDVPLTSSQSVLGLSFSNSNTIFYRYDTTYFTDALQVRLPLLTVQTVSSSISSSQRAAIVTSSAAYDRVIVITNDWKPTFTSNQVSMVQELLNAGRRVVYVSFGSPYQVLQFPSVKNHFAAFSSHFESQYAMADVLTGLAPASARWPVTVAADLQVSATVSSPVRSGVPVTYTIMAINNGPDPLTSGTLSDTIPAGCTFVSASPGGTLSGQTVKWGIGRLLPGQSTSTTVTVLPLPGTNSLSNVSSVTGRGMDLVPGNNTVTLNNPVEKLVNLGVTKECFPETVGTGRELGCEIAVTNDGPDAATGVLVHDALFSSASVVSASHPWEMTGSAVVFDVGSIAAGAATTVSVVLLPLECGGFIDQATVTCNETDTDLADNTAFGIAQVVPSVSGPFVYQEDNFTTDVTNMDPGGTTGWTPLGSFVPGFVNGDYDTTQTALRVTVSSVGTPTLRIAGWMTADSERMPFAGVGSSDRVRARFHVFSTGQQNPSDFNQVPNMRLRVSSRFAMNSMLEVFNHLQGDPAGTNLGRELRPSADPANPSVYRVDFDPVRVPALETAGEGVSRGFEAYCLENQENGSVELAESSIGIYSSDCLTSSQLLKVYQTSATDAGDLKVFNTLTDLMLGKYSLAWVPDATPGGFPTYSESTGGITLDTMSVASDRNGIGIREFFPGSPVTSRVRVEEDRQYRLRWHVTSATNANTNPQLRLRARAIKFMWSQKLEIGGAFAAGGMTATIAQQALPGVGCMNPDQMTPGETGGWYTLIVHTPLSTDIRPDATGTINDRMPLIAAQPGPGEAGDSTRDLKAGMDVIDTISAGAQRALEAGQFTCDRIEVWADELVQD